MRPKCITSPNSGSHKIKLHCEPDEATLITDIYFETIGENLIRLGCTIKTLYLGKMTVHDDLRCEHSLEPEVGLDPCWSLEC